MSDFTAKFQAILDTSKIPSQIASIEKTPIKLSKITLDTKNLPSQIQASLDGHNFTIKLDGIKMANINSQANQAGRSYSQAFADGVRTQLSNGGIEASIARVTAQYEKLATSGHGYLSKVATDLQHLNDLHNDLATNTGDNTALVNTYRRFSETLTNVRNNLITVSSQTKSIASQSQIEALGSKMTTWMLNNTKASGQYGANIASLQSRLAALGSNVPVSELNRLSEEFEQVKLQANAAGLAGDSFSTSIKKSFKNISSYISIATVLRQSVEVCREMAENVLAIDTAMTGLYRVTSLTNAQYKQLYGNMAKSAKDYGAELTTIIDATTNWTKLGFEVNVAKQLAEVTTMYQQVADLDTKTAVNNLVTAYKGYEKQLLALTGGDTVAAVEYIADVFNKLGNEFAVEAFDIGAALNNSASALEVAGNTMQQSAGMATGIIEVTQDASRAGSALRTLSMRLRGTTAEELEAIGEDAEGLIVVTSKMHATIKKLTGVDLVDANGQLRSTYEVMDDIAHVWDSLDPNTQANVLETIAGKNRASDIQALINNWESVETAVKSATDATGTARKEYEVFLESLQAHLNRIETAWQKLSYSFMDVGLLETGADVLVGILDALDGIVNTLGSAGTIGAGVGLFALFKNFDGIKSFISLIGDATKGVGTFADVIANAKMSLSSFIKTPMGVASAIGLVTVAISAAVQAYKNWREEQERERQESIENARVAKEEYNSISELYDRYTALKEIEDTNTDAKEELTAVTSDLLKALGVEQSELQGLIDKYDGLDNAIRNVSAEVLASKLSDATKGFGAAQESLEQAIADGYFTNFNMLDFMHGEGGKVFADTLADSGLISTSSYGSGGGALYLGENETAEDAVAIYNKLIQMRTELENHIGDGYNRTELGTSNLYKAINAKIALFESEYEAYFELMDTVNTLVTQQEYDRYIDQLGIPETQEEFDALKAALLSLGAASDSFVGDQENIQNTIVNTLASIPELSQFFREYTQEIGDIDVPAYIKFPQLIADTDSKTDYIDRLNSIREQAEYLQETLGKIRDGELSEGEKIDLFTAHPSLANAEDLEAGVVGLIDSLKGASATAEAEASGIMAVFDEMYAQIDPEDTEGIASLDALKNAYLSLFSTVEENTPVFKNLSDAISGVGDASELIATVQEEMAESGQISLATLEKMAKEFGSNIGDYFTIGEDGKITADIEKIKTYYVDAIKEMELEDANLEQSLIDALSNGFDESKFNFDALTSAMSKAQEVASIAAGAQKDIAYDTVESLREIFGQDFENYIITDEAGNYISANTEALREYARGLLEAGNASDATLAEFDAMWQSTLDGTKEAETALDRVSTALSNVSDVSSYLTLLESDDLNFVDALEQAVKLLEAMGDDYSLDDFFTFSDSGDITYNTEFLTTWLDAYIDKMVDAGDISEDFADQMKAAAKAEIEQVNAIEKLTDAMSEVEKASDLIATAQEEIEKNGKNSIETVMSLYEQFGDKANAMFSPSGDGGFIIDTTLVKQEMYDLIDTLEEASPEIKQAMKDALDIQLEEEAFEDVVDEYVSKVETLKETLETLRSDGKLSDSALYDLVKEFPELATETDNLDEAITSLLGTMKTDIVAKFQEQFGKIDSEEDREELQAFMDIVLKLGEVVGETQFAIDINAEAEGMQNLFDAMKESVSATGLTAESISNLKKRYQDLEGYEPAKLFERTENGIHLNTKALRQLESEYESFTKAKIDTKLDELVADYNELTRQIDAAGTTASTVDLYAQRNKILAQINETADLAAQYAGLTSNFYKWEQAQSIGEEGDMYDSLTGGLEDIKQLYKDGLIGTNKFRTAVQLMSNEDLSNATSEELIKAYEAGYPKMKKYFQDSSDGVLHFLNDVQDLNSEWVHLNKDGSWDINFGVGNDQEIADALGINVEAVQAIMRKLSDYGFDINLDTMYSNIDTMQSKAEKAAAKLKELGKTDVDFNFGATNIERINEQIEDAKEALKQFQNEDGSVNLDIEGAQEAQYVLATLVLQKQALETPMVMSVDADNIEGTVGETLRKLQKIKQDYNDLQLNAAIGADTSSIQSSIDETISSFTTEEIEILGNLGIDPTTSAETINTAIADITPEMLIAVGVDETAVTAFAETDHDTEATVVYNVDGSKVARYSPAKKYGTVQYTASMYAWTPPTKYGTVYYTAKTVGGSSGSSTGGSYSRNFNTVAAVARGTAYANGDWSTKRSGTALGGELGREIVVRNGKFFTIGDNGAEFFQYKKGDIIFNHKQTEQLLNNGKITSATPRGKALADGTAFSAGSGTVTGSGSVITKPSGSGSDGGDGGSESKSSIKDWIEVAVNRIERAINRLGTIAQSAYKSLENRLHASDDEIKKVIDEIALQDKAYTRYYQQAESVGLSNELKIKVQNGTIDITEYDEETSKLIEDYQQWYEKALDCADAIDELHETLASLWEDKFNAISADFDNQLSLIEHRVGAFNTNLDEIEARGYMGGSELYNALIATESDKVQKLKAELADLTKAMSDGINSGEIEVGSEAWYAMQVSINEAKLAIQESELAVVEFNNALRDIEWEHFDYLQNRISQITQEADFLINLLSDSDLYTDKGQLSDTGMATMGLHGVNYNTYLAQAEQYAEEIKKLNEDIAKDPYNTALIERREELLALQQDSITAAEAEKQAIVDMVEEGINLELSSLKELIDAYTDSLDSAKDLYDYQKKVKKQTAEVASLQKQLAAYQNDTSEENRARLQKLQVDLSDAMEDLEETQYDRYIKEQKRLLDNFYDDYEENLNRRLDNVDALISDMIDTVNANSGSIADTITGECADVGYTLSSSMNSIWQSGGGAYDVISTYGNAFTEQLTTLNQVISGIAANVASMVTAGDQIADETISNTTTVTDPIETNPPTSNITEPTPPPATTPTTPTTPNTPTTPDTPSTEPEKEKKKKVKITSGTWHIRAGAGTKYDVVGYAHEGDTFDYLGKSGSWNAVSYKGSKRWIYNEGSKLIEGYSQGGYIAELQKIAMRNGDDLITVNTLKKGEAILTPEQAVMFSKFVNGGLPVMHSVLNMTRHMNGITSTPSQLNQPITNENNFEFNIEIDHVEDYNDLVTKMRDDPKFERMVEIMSINKLGGNRQGALAKRNCQWK